PPQALPHLFQLGVPSEEIDLVLLSHAHSDHIGGVDLFLLDAVYRTWPRRTRPLAVGGPPGIYDRLREVIGESERLPPRDDPRITWFEGGDGASFEWADATVECFEVDHDPALTSLAFRVRAGDSVVAYSGDTRPCAAVERLAEGADLLVLECGVGTYHFDWPDVLALRSRLPASTQVLVTHYPDEGSDAVRGVPGLRLAEDFGTYEA
ncbi:MAG TPA: MBL fold metallo-hydrolase, partial [Dehalococcoidia bacterium]|nr:MBL fold metallo-hydrolase [Dehalococcoidia bacterium]